MRGLSLKTLTEIVDEIYKNDDTKATKTLITAIANSLITRVGDSLKDGEEVRLSNLGTFTLTHREARMGRNPATGEQVQIAAKTAIKFKATKTLADAVA